MAKILIIEDDHALRNIVVQGLGDTHEVYEADNGFSGLEIATAYLPDLVICDIAMHGMDGYSVLTHLRSEEATAEISFIFLTAHSGREWMRRGMDLGADDFLTKPFSLIDLQQAVETRLVKKALRDMLINKKVNELRDNILTALPHELRTAIMVIEGYTHLLMDDLSHLGGEQMQMLQAIADGTARLQRLSEKYLWYSRSQFVKFDEMADCSTVNAEIIIRDTALTTAARFGRSHDLKLDTLPSKVRIDEHVLRRIIEELVENACKFSGQGTQIAIRIGAQQHFFKIMVEDQGRGMTEAQIAQIGAFKQFDREQYEQQGIGLGFVIVKRFAEAYGGKFVIKSMLQKGTKAAFYVPHGAV